MCVQGTVTSALDFNAAVDAAALHSAMYPKGAHGGERERTKCRHGLGHLPSHTQGQTNAPSRVLLVSEATHNCRSSKRSTNLCMVK